LLSPEIIVEVNLSPLRTSHSILVVFAISAAQPDMSLYFISLPVARGQRHERENGQNEIFSRASERVENNTFEVAQFIDTDRELEISICIHFQ
jgi:hypothetical protein